MRDALLVEIDPQDLGTLTFLAGLLVGMGRTEAEVLNKIISNWQVMEVEDDFGQLEPPDNVTTIDFQGNPDNTGAVPAPPLEIEDEEFQPIDVNTDPTAPENLGITLNQPAESEPDYTPFAEEGDFGAGPIPTNAN